MPFEWSLKALRVFEVAARHPSFSSAAEELCVTQGAVSKQIKGLEENLGFDLFERSANGLSLNKQGQELSKYLRSMFEDLDAHIQKVSTQETQGPLVISCEPTICLRLLIPLLPDLMQETGLDVRVLSGGGPVDFRSAWVDLAVRRADFLIPKSHYQISLGPEYMGPVHHPSLIKAWGEADEYHRRIRSDTRLDAWEDWEAGNQPFPFKTEFSYQQHFLALEAAENGLGVAMASVYMVARSLERGSMVSGGDFCADGSEYVCLSKAPFEDDPRKQVFADWLVAKFAAIREKMPPQTGSEGAIG